MIHEIFTLERPLIFFDLETTGVQKNDRIVEIGFQVFTSEGLTKEWSSYINPEIPIGKEASEANHITDELVQSCRICRGAADKHPTTYRKEDGNEEFICDLFHPWPKFGQIAENIAKGFSNCDFGGKNVRFDIRIMQEEMNRVGVPWSIAGARIIDGERLEQLAVPRTLSDLYEKYTGQKLVGAHGALVDTRASSVVVFHQMRNHSRLPRSLDLLHEMQWPGWIDSERKFRFVKGVPTCTFGKWNGVPMHLIDPGYWNWILRSDFNPEIKKLASDALIKVFPEMK